GGQSSCIRYALSELFLSGHISNQLKLWARHDELNDSANPLPATSLRLAQVPGEPGRHVRIKVPVQQQIDVMPHDRLGTLEHQLDRALDDRAPRLGAEKELRAE